jgi:hypothetical protein
MGDQVPRLDLCSDVSGPGAPTVRALAEAVRRREWATRARRALLMDGLGTGDYTTLYVGSKSSDRRLRVYDERGALRVESTLRDEAACAGVERALAAGCDVAWREVVRSMVAFPTVPGWEALMA